MTREELKQHKDLCKELEIISSTLQVLERDVRSATISVGEIVSSKIKRKLPTKIEAAVDLREIYEDMYVQRLKERRRIETFINSLPSSRDRNIMRARYVLHLEWWKVANVVGYSEVNCKKRDAAILNKELKEYTPVYGS